MPKNINERYKNDPVFRERMKENSRRRYGEMRTALAVMKEQEALAKSTPPVPPASPPPSSAVVQSSTS